MNTTVRDGVDQTLLKEYLSYSPETGELTWIKKPAKKVYPNSRAGSLVSTTGYRSINFMGRSFREHHVVWCWYYGYWPAKQLDHINQIRSDNRIENLREVTIAENAQNRRKAANTKLNEAGIWYDKRLKQYVAEITQNRKKVYQKRFTDIDEAIKARKAKLLELGFHNNHGN